MAEPPPFQGAGIQPGQRHPGPWTGNKSFLHYVVYCAGEKLLFCFSNPLVTLLDKIHHLLRGQEALVKIEKSLFVILIVFLVVTV